MSHFEIVRTDRAYPWQPQPWHARLVASNGNIIMTTENYTRRSRAESAIAVAAEAFGVSMNRPPTREPDTGSRLLGVNPAGHTLAYDVRYVDERGQS